MVTNKWFKVIKWSLESNQVARSNFELLKYENPIRRGQKYCLKSRYRH